MFLTPVKIYYQGGKPGGASMVLLPSDSSLDSSVFFLHIQDSSTRIPGVGIIMIFLRY